MKGGGIVKNTLTINANDSCKCECLDKIDDGTNSIWINVVTYTEGVLEFLYNGETMVEAVTEEPFEVPSEWYLTEDLQFRFVDAHHTGDYFTLHHPPTTKGDMWMAQAEDNQFEYDIRFHESDTGGGGGEYTLPPATTTTLGGIKVGGGLSVKSDGTLSADAQKIDVDDALSNTSKNPVQNKVITARLDEVFQSVSDGKSLVASAITDKGVETSADSTFAVLAENVSKINTGGGAGIGELVIVSDSVSDILTYEVSAERIKKYKYGDAYLPKLPDYAYQIIRKNDETGYYDCIVSDYPFVWTDSETITSSGSSAYFYRVSQTIDDSRFVEWSLYRSYTSSTDFGNDSNRVIFWTNVDILDSSGNVKMTAGTVVVE